MTTHARAERQALCDSLVAFGPDAPTLCDGWLTRDLAAHVVVRERRPDAQVALVVPPLAGHAEKVRSGLSGQDWAELIQTVRSGPPIWHPARLRAVDEAMNLAEFFVHHEDVLRAQPGWSPRPLSDELSKALWRACGTVGRLALRPAKVGVELVAPGHGRVTAKRGHPVVRVEGTPGEILLFALGRRDAAQVDLDGPNQAVDELRGSSSGI